MKQIDLWVVIASGLLVAGCASHPPVHPDLSSRLTQIKTVAISPPYVVAYLQPYHLWMTRKASPGAAEPTLNTAVREEFSRSGCFAIQDVDLLGSALAPPTPPWAVPDPHPGVGSDWAGYGPVLVRPDGMKFRPKAFTPPPEGFGADAALFSYGWEKTKTGGAIFKMSVGGAWFMPVELITDLCGADSPRSFVLDSVTRREVCIGLCLIDCHTGEVLWSDIEACYGTGKLEDGQTARRLVARSYKKFSKHLPTKASRT